MRICTLLAILAAMLAPGMDARAESPLHYAPLHPISECLDPDRIRTWYFIDSDEVLVDAGRRRFLLQLASACPELSSAQEVAFLAGNSVGRICGNLGDSILGATGSTIRVPCRIAVVRPLDKSTFEAELARGREGRRGVVTVRKGVEGGH